MKCSWFSGTINIHISDKHNIGRLSIQQRSITLGLVNDGVHQTAVGNKIYFLLIPLHCKGNGMICLQNHLNSVSTYNTKTKIHIFIYQLHVYIIWWLCNACLHRKTIRRLIIKYRATGSVDNLPHRPQNYLQRYVTSM
jgi:hypothetical protein